MTIPSEILNQLGGGKFVAMTGAACYSDGDYTLVVKFKGSRAFNTLRVTLEAMDVYTMKFLKVTPSKVIEGEEIRGVYNDMLQQIFKRETGLNTTL